MIVDITTLQQFYRTPLGQVAQRFVARSLVEFIRGAQDCRMLGLGYAAPYLRPAIARCERVNLFMPARQGVAHWPPDEKNLACLVEPLVLPVVDGMYERALVAHLLESVGDPDEFLHEIWRVLAPGGRVAIIAPNRRGIWARVDATPFGQGRPYSISQLDDLLHRNGFDVLEWREALYVPPIPSERFLRSAGIFERIGVKLSAPFAGVHVVEAARQEQRPIPVRQQRRRLRFAPNLAPATKPAGAPVPQRAGALPTTGPLAGFDRLLRRNAAHRNPAYGKTARETLSPDHARAPEPPQDGRSATETGRRKSPDTA